MRPFLPRATQANFLEELLFDDHDALPVISLFMNIDAWNLTNSRHCEITQNKRYGPYQAEASKRGVFGKVHSFEEFQLNIQ